MISDLERRTLQWLATSRPSTAAKSLAFFGVFGIRTDPCHHPMDVRDLDACLQLVDFLPEIASAVPEMATLTPGWAAIAQGWERLSASHVDELGLGWSKSLAGPRTAQLLRDVLADLDSVQKGG